MRQIRVVFEEQGSELYTPGDLTDKELDDAIQVLQTLRVARKKSQAENKG